MLIIERRWWTIAGLALVAGVAVCLPWLPRWTTSRSQGLAPLHAGAPAVDAKATPAGPPADTSSVLPLTFEPMTTADAILSNSQWPTSTLPNPSASKFVLAAQSGTDRDRAIECLTQAVYFEAAFEPPDGQRAVAQVVLNRVRHPLFPHTVCGVVYQGSELPTGCQFTFTCDGSLQRTPALFAWTQAKQIAEAALNGYVAKDIGEATHYHADYVVPFWRSSLVKVRQIGAHIFYRWPGNAGLPKTFNLAYAGSEPMPKVLFGPLLGADDPSLRLVSGEGDPSSVGVEQALVTDKADSLKPPPALSPVAPRHEIGVLQQMTDALPNGQDLVTPRRLGRAALGSTSLACRPGAC